MSQRLINLLTAVAASAAVASFAAVTVAGQAPSAKSQAPVAKSTTGKGDQKWVAPRTADGQPDLQGVWNYSTLTPFERPASLTGKTFFASPEEGKAWLKEEVARRDKDRRDDEGGSAEADVERAYNAVWWDF